MSEHDSPRHEEAERYFERAQIMLESRLASREEAMESALNNAKKAFELHPENPNYFNLFLQVTLATRQSICRLGVDAALDAALQNPDCREVAFYIIAHVRLQVMEVMDNDFDLLKKFSFGGEIDLLEKLITIDRRPDALHTLYLFYKLSGRQHEGMAFFKEAAETKPENYGSYYIMACKNQERYQELIEYYEKNEAVLLPMMSDDHKTVVAIAYEKRAAGLEWQDRIRFENEGMPADSLDDYRKSKAIYQRIAQPYESLLTGGQPVTSEGSVALINYAQIHVLEAQCIQHSADEQIDKTTALELKRKALAILNPLIERMSAIGYPESSDLYRHLLLAKTHVLSASSDVRLGIEAVERAIAFAKELQGDKVFLALSFADILPNNLSGLLHIRNHLLGKETDPELEEELLCQSLVGNWKNLQSYAPLVQFYLKTGDNEMAHRIEQVCALVPFLENLIKLDKFGRQDFDNCALGIAQAPESHDVKTYNAALQKVYDSLQVTHVALEEHLKPLHDAFEPFRESYKAYLAKIAPENALIDSRLKMTYSVILKLLKERNVAVPDVTDFLAFRVLTDTEEEARVLYEKVRLGMRKDRSMKEWITIDKPTKTNYRSMDITGTIQGDDIQLQVQIRSKAIDAEISAGFAHHGYYKRESGWKLEEAINKNPIPYLWLLNEIVLTLGNAYRFIRDSETPLTLHELLEIYRDPPLPHLPDQPSR
ncbi:hypothetical protein JW752_02530 [Candidatus Peregrinibacteria bacterium]|nr:hypothetical protein [Candidatus Peregrinibacteria bacterium]